MRYKKAIFFSITALLILGLLFMFMLLRKEMPVTREEAIVKNRVSAMNDFIVDVERSYIPRIIRTITIKRLSETDKLITKDYESLIHAIERGDVNDPSDPRPQDTSLRHHFRSLEHITKQQMPVNLVFSRNPDGSLDVGDFQIFQDGDTGPCFVKVRLRTSYNVTSDLASWERDVEIIDAIPIVDFEVDGFDVKDFKKGGGESFIGRYGGEDNGCCGMIHPSEDPAASGESMGDCSSGGNFLRVISHTS